MGFHKICQLVYDEERFVTTEKLKAMEDLAKSLGVVFTVVLLMHPIQATKVKS